MVEAEEEGDSGKVKFQEDKKRSRIIPRGILALVIISSVLAFILIYATIPAYFVGAWYNA